MSKYNAKQHKVGVYTFDSKVEADYYKHLVDKGIEKIVIHPFYPLIDKFEKNGKKYRGVDLEADFEFVENGKTRIVDIKGMATETAKLKRKLFEYFHPLETIEWIVRYGGERVQYEDNEKRKRDNKKKK